jgi:trafficking protein particle complex subunit 6
MSARDSLALPRGVAGASTSTLNLAIFSDPAPRLADGASFDYFVAEVTATLRHSAAVATARQQAIEDEMVAAGLVPPPPPAKKEKESQRDSVQSISSSKKDVKGIQEDDEPLRRRLDAIGAHVGANITERCVGGFSI